MPTSKFPVAVAPAPIPILYTMTREETRTGTKIALFADGQAVDVGVPRNSPVNADDELIKLSSAWSANDP